MAQLDWLEAAADSLNEDPNFRKLGSTDLVLGLKAGRIVRIVTFEAFSITTVSTADETALRDCDLVIDMSPRDWTRYLRRLAKGTGPSLLSLDLDRDVVSAGSPLGQIKFQRYHLTLQALFDEGAKQADMPRLVEAAS